MAKKNLQSEACSFYGYTVLNIIEENVDDLFDAYEHEVLCTILINHFVYNSSTFKRELKKKLNKAILAMINYCDFEPKDIFLSGDNYTKNDVKKLLDETINKLIDRNLIDYSTNWLQPGLILSARTLDIVNKEVFSYID
ncbi:hypothetical protein FQP34_22070 [Peribacillus simplex]|uniref:Uncharacterized protein n=1 Tax=Peribacillus simplex TaxID=1478 RepID=A0A8B5XU72_9BACI|nr:hypothetical protein [Peribacillus simplex]TVX77822.1 hypothetical protein FQP34_22070 [Peribacillus simplex]